MDSELRAELQQTLDLIGEAFSDLVNLSYGDLVRLTVDIERRLSDLVYPDPESSPCDLHMQSPWTAPPSNN